MNAFARTDIFGPVTTVIPKQYRTAELFCYSIYIIMSYNEFDIWLLKPD